MSQTHKSIAFQGAKGAYSDLACRTMFPDLETVACQSFSDAFEAVENGNVDLAMIPVDNTIAGRVADVHHLMPKANLYIIGEHYQPINHTFLGMKGANLDNIKHVHSHIHALPQCQEFIKKHSLQSHVHADTAGAAQDIAKKQDPAHGAIASKLAAEIYDLEILAENIEDTTNNVTRFIVLSREPDMPDVQSNDMIITSLLFGVRNIPASLYKSLGGFATNGLNMVKLESYVDESLRAAHFYCEVEGHPDERNFQLALEELGFYASDVKFLGTYIAHDFRNKKSHSLEITQ